MAAPENIYYLKNWVKIFLERLTMPLLKQFKRTLKVYNNML